MKTDNEVSFYVECGCRAEILGITYWEDDNPREYFLTMYRSSFGRGFWWRLKQAWQYFRYGEFEGNSICLSEFEYDTFVDLLIENKTKD